LPSWKKSMHTWMRRLLSFTRKGDIEVIRQQFMVVNNFFKPRHSGHLLISLVNRWFDIYLWIKLVFLSHKKIISSEVVIFCPKTHRCMTSIAI
jgi:hypothetical protein